MFRFYITDTFDGSVKGTNDIQVAETLATASEYFVVDTQTNQWIQEDGQRIPVEPIPISV